MKRGFSVIGFLATISILAIIYLIITISIRGLYYGYSDGERTGTVFKWSEKGLFYKSFEGSMYLGGMETVNGNLQMAQFDFSLVPSNDNKELIEKVKECASKKSQCTIYYKQWLIPPVWQSTDYNVISVN